MSISTPMASWTSRLVLLALLAAALLVLPPASAATQSSAQFTFGDVSQFYLIESYTGSDARTLRQTIDAAGNGDGTVTEAEREAWNERHVFGAATGCFEDGFAFLIIDGRSAKTVTHGYAQVTPAIVGPVDNPDTVKRNLLVSFDTNRMRGGSHVSLRLSEMWDLTDAWTCAEAPQPGPFAARPTYIFLAIQDTDSVTPAALRQTATTADGTGLQLDEPQEIETAWTNTIRFRHSGDDGPILLDIAEAAGVSLGLLALVAAIGSLVSQAFRDRLTRLLAIATLPLYTRIRREKTLDHERRERLYAFIRDHQGATFAELRRELDLGSGSLAHHLRVLEGQGFVKPYRDGVRDRFYLHGPQIEPDAYLSRTQRALLAVIHAQPGITQKEVARRVGLTRQSVAYHERNLVEKGRMRAESSGRLRRYFPVTD